MKRTYFGIIVLTALLGFVPVFAKANSVSVSIQSLSPSNNVAVGTQVSFSVSASGFTNPAYALSDSFSGGTLSSSDINSSGNFSWTPSSSDIGTHTVTITVSDSAGDSGITTETITVTPAPGISIQSLNPGSTVSVGTNVTFLVSTTGLNNPVFGASDSFNGSSVSSSNINSSGNFSWTPGNQDVGTHTITITASDGSGHSGIATETITVTSAPTVLIQSLSPGTSVTVNQQVTFNVSVSGFNNPSYSVSDSFGGSTVSSSDINSSGYFSWAPQANDAGTHTINIIVSDGSGHTATASQTIFVQSATAGIEDLSPGESVTLGEPISFTVNSSGFTNPTYTLSDTFQGSTVSNSDINSSGYFSWTPTSADYGTHNITVHITDSLGHTGTASQYIAVESPYLTISSIYPSQSVNPGTNVTFTVTQSGLTNPTYQVSDSFPNSSLSYSDINSSSGYFSWTPTESDGGSHVISVSASDVYGHTANTSATINVGYVAGTSVPSDTSGSFTEFLSVGSSDSQVTLLQTLLTKEGLFSGPITGYFGPLTETAVENFQTSHDIDAVGTVGPLTRNVLNQLEGTATVTGTDSAGCVAGGAYSTTTGEPCTQTGTAVSGCAAGNTYSTTTGQYCGTATETSSVTTSSTQTGYQFNTLLQVGSTGEDVTELQDRLTADGIYSGPITGYYGSLTETAVEAFQIRHSLEAVGYVGPETRALLNAGN